MSRDHPAPDPRRALPSVDAGLQQMGDAVVRWGHGEVSQAIRETLAQARQQLDRGHPVEVSTEALRQRVAAELHARRDIESAKRFVKDDHGGPHRQHRHQTDKLALTL